MKLNIDKSFISSLLHSKDLSVVKDKQIRASFLTTDSRNVFEFICNYYELHGKMPTERVLKRYFSEYEFERIFDEENDDMVIGTVEPLTYWCDEVRNKVKHNRLGDTAGTMIDLLNDGQHEKAYEEMKKTLLVIEGDIEETSAINTADKNAIQSRIDRYNKRSECGGILGIPTGIKGLDYMLKGLQDKQLITLVASTGVGKTWFECIIGAHAQRNGYKVLHFTTEMSEEQILDRYDVLQTAFYYGDINYNRFTAGELTNAERENYFKYLTVKAPKLEPLIIDTAEGAMGVSAKIDLYNPDIILIDGAYLMIDETSRRSVDDWLRVCNVWRALKKIAKNKAKPIFVNTQADSTTSKKTGAGLENIGFAKSIGHDSDVVMTMYRDEQMLEDHETKLRLLKHREGSLGSVMMTWDFRTMTFEEIYSDYEKNDTEEISDKKSPKKTKAKVKLKTKRGIKL